VDVTILKSFCKEHELSFFLSSLFYSLKAIHQIDEFCYRWQNEHLVCYDRIDAGSTILLDDNSFGFCYFPLTDSVDEFNRQGQELIAVVKETHNFELKDGLTMSSIIL